MNKHSLRTMPWKTRLSLFVSFATLLVSALPARADLPRPTATFAKGVVLTVGGYAGSTTLQDFPVLVRIAERDAVAGTGIDGFYYSDLQNASAADPDDIDIAFIDMDGDGLPYEIDTWNPSGESLVWVQLPAVASSGTQFVMCWGGAQSGKSLNSASPWDGTSYKSVFHMTFDGATTTDSIAGYTGTIANANEYAGGAAGTLAGGVYRCTQNKTLHWITVSSIAAFQSATDGIATYSGWFKSLGYYTGNTDHEDGRIRFGAWGNCGDLWNTKNGGQSGGKGIEFGVEAGNNGNYTYLKQFALRDNGGDFKKNADVETLYDGAWHHVALSYKCRQADRLPGRCAAVESEQRFAWYLQPYGHRVDNAHRRAL